MSTLAGSKEDLRGLMTLPEAENSLSAEAEDAETNENYEISIEVFENYRK